MSLDGSGEGLPTPAPLGETQTPATPKPPRWHLGENRLRSFLDGLRGNQAPSSLNVRTPETSQPVTPRETLPPPSNTRRV